MNAKNGNWDEKTQRQARSISNLFVKFIVQDRRIDDLNALCQAPPMHWAGGDSVGSGSRAGELAPVSLLGHCAWTAVRTRANWPMRPGITFAIDDQVSMTGHS
jgi:hypothetical protein